MPGKQAQDNQSPSSNHQSPQPQGAISKQELGQMPQTTTAGTQDPSVDIEEARTIAEQFRKEIHGTENPPTPGTITVELKDEKNSYPMRGTKVILLDADLIEYYSRQTNSRGVAVIQNEIFTFEQDVKYALSGLIGGKDASSYYLLQNEPYILILLAPNYRPKALAAHFVHGENMALKVAMQKEAVEQDYVKGLASKKTASTKEMGKAYFKEEEITGNNFELKIRAFESVLGKIKILSGNKMVDEKGNYVNEEEIIARVNTILKSSPKALPPQDPSKKAVCCFCVYSAGNADLEQECSTSTLFISNGINNCEMRIPVSTTAFSSKFLKSYKTSCSDSQFVFNYHGPKCDTMSKLVEVCSIALPTTKIRIQDMSCQTFSHAANAVRALVRAQKRLKGSGKITITGYKNDGVSQKLVFLVDGTPVVQNIPQPHCSVKTTIEVTSGQIKVSAGGCMETDAKCSPPNPKKEYDCAENGIQVKQYCCPSGKKEYLTAENGEKMEVGIASEPGVACNLQIKLPIQSPPAING